MLVKEKRNYIISNEDADVLLVPKIIYGIDAIGTAFIYMKLKDFKSKKYIDDCYVMFYQKPYNIDYDDKVIQRQEKIIEWLKSKFEIGSVRNFSNKNHFFIKHKLFKEIKKIESFYNNIINDLIQYCELEVRKEYMELTDFTKTAGVLNINKN